MELEKRIFAFAFGLLLFTLIMVLLTSCNPYDGLSPPATPTTEPTARSGPTITGISTPRPSCTVTTGVPAGYLNIRTGAGVQYAVIGLLQEGDVLWILTRGAWLQVMTRDDLTGFVNSKYCKEIQP